MKPEKQEKDAFYERVVALLESARSKAVQQVNQTMVAAYFEIGRMIVEEQQGGDDRAGYGDDLINALSRKLTDRFGKGFSSVNLRQMRTFYLTYSKQQTLSAKSGRNQSSSDLSRLSWSHYLKLMRMDDLLERRFYEIECVENN